MVENVSLLDRVRVEGAAFSVLDLNGSILALFEEPAVVFFSLIILQKKYKILVQKCKILK